MQCSLTAKLYIFCHIAGCFLQGGYGSSYSTLGNVIPDDPSWHFRTESYAGAGTEFYAEEVWLDKGDTSGGVTEKCMKFLEAFSNSTASFLWCAITNARPLHYCENCVGEFMSVNRAYDDIVDDDIKNGSTCQDELLRADDVQVVVLAYNFVQDLWEKSTCRNCYYTDEKNGTTVYRATKETLEMLKKIQETQECFHDFGAESEPLNLTVCAACQKFYSSANVYYNDLDEEGKLCSDLEDSMNYTRRMWSKEYKCTVIDKNDLVIYCIAFSIGSLPLILYLGVWVFDSHQKKKARERAAVSAEVSTPLDTDSPREI